MGIGLQLCEALKTVFGFAESRVSTVSSSVSSPESLFELSFRKAFFQRDLLLWIQRNWKNSEWTLKFSFGILDKLPRRRKVCLKETFESHKSGEDERGQIKSKEFQIEIFNGLSNWMFQWSAFERMVFEWFECFRTFPFWIKTFDGHWTVSRHLVNTEKFSVRTFWYLVLVTELVNELVNTHSDAPRNSLKLLVSFGLPWKPFRTKCRNGVKESRWGSREKWNMNLTGIAGIGREPVKNHWGIDGKPDEKATRNQRTF